MKFEFERQFVGEWRQQKLTAAAAGIAQAVGKRLAAVHSVVEKRGRSYFIPPQKVFRHILFKFYSLLLHK